MSALTLQTRALFDEAPYQHCFTARVLAVSEQGVALDQTLFYPTGGGQPGVQGPGGIKARLSAAIQETE